MREKKVTWAMVLVVVIVVAAIGASIAIRRDGHSHNHADTAGNSHDEGSSVRQTGESGMELSGVIKDDQRVITMKARQFEFEPNSIVVKKDETIKLEVTSEDVTHGIDIEGYNINRELKPNETKIIIFTADKEGQFHFHCSVYCGTGHSDMHGELIVLGLSDGPH